MRILRWISFIPIAAMAAIFLGILWANYFHEASFYKQNFLASIVGLAPRFLGRFLPIICFVLTGAAIAPRRAYFQIGLLGTLGAVFGWPFGPRYFVSEYSVTFYATEALGALFGAAIGMLVAISLWRAKPNTSAKPKTSGHDS
jgi:hypothetical protein